MVEWLLIALLAGGSCFTVFLFFSFIREGIKDDLAYPLGNCDTSTFEELLGD